MSLMSNLHLGTSGLQMSQNALNTTAHNMSNIDTVGYTRQQVQQGTRFYNTASKNSFAISWEQYGLGVNYSNVKRIRDYFLDQTYRRESGRSAYYDVGVEALEEVENLFQELQGVTFSSALTNLWGSVEELSKSPSDSVKQGVFMQRCNEFITRAKAVYKGLSEYQDDLNYNIKLQVDTINAYSEKIKDLNIQIMKVEGGNVEHANDLRDQRDLLLDELSAMGNISYYEDVDGNVIVRFEDNDLVMMDSCNKIDLWTDDVTGFYTPYWTNLVDNANDPIYLGAEVINMHQAISTESNTDIGSLKSMLFARGDHRATYEDLKVPDDYNQNISQSIIMNVQAEFDQLINGIVTSINQVFADAAKRATEIDVNSTYMRYTDSDGNPGDPYQIFNTISGSSFSVNNIIINGELQQAPSLLGFIRPHDDKEDQETADLLKKVFTEEKYTLNPNVETRTSLINYYDNLISQVANTGSILRGISENQQTTVDNTAAAREQIVGVSSDEELTYMIMFQNAYNAASRYINVVNEMLEHILNTLGR